MTVWNSWVSSFVMRCQAFAAADFSCFFFFVGLSTFSLSSASENACLIGLRSGVLLVYCRIFHFLPSKTPGSFAIVHLYYEAPSNQLCCIWLNLGRQYIPVHFRMLLSSVISSVNTSNPVPLEAMHAHVITLLHHVSQMMLCAWIMSCSKSSPYFFLPVILVQVDLNFSCP